MPSNKPACLLLFIAFTMHAAAQNSQENILDSFASKLITAVKTNQTERAYVVTDRSVYKAGEYLWFKAFVLKTASFKESYKSRFLFVDIVDDNDSIVKQVIIDRANDTSDYRLQLSDHLFTGYYWLRAYTRQMAQSDTNSIAIKPLYIVGTPWLHPPKQKNNITGTGDPVINFYPEGGNIIPGINSTVALLATAKSGNPLSINGYVKDSRGDTTTHFTTNAAGLARFNFEPSGYRKYEAVINSEGKELHYPLPPFNFFTGQLSVTKTSGWYKLRILLGDSIYTKDALTYVVGISKDSVVFASVGAGQYETTINEHTLPKGITSFYLFDKNLKLLSERTVYVNADAVNINITPDKNTYAKHDRVSLNVSSTDAEQHVVPALLALSVTDSALSSVPDICSFSNLPFDLDRVDNLFLARNLCFNDSDIDLIMLTKNNTYQLANQLVNNANINNNDSLFYIKGAIINNKTEPLANQVVTIISKTSNPVFYKDTTDANGRFSFPTDSYADSTEFILEIKTLKGNSKNNKVVFDEPDVPKLKTPAALKQYPLIEAKTKQRLNFYYKDQFGENQLPTVIVTDSIAVDYDASKRVSPFSSIIHGKDLDGRTTLDNLILKVSGVQILNGFLVIHGNNALTAPGPNSEPLIMVNGANVVSPSNSVGAASPAINYLHSVNPKDVDFVEILKNADAAAYGEAGGNGVILINTTNKGKDFILDKNNMQEFYVKGVLEPVAFPEYSIPKKSKKTEAAEDNRSTLYWNGGLLTGNADRAISFYTSDIPAVYTITVTGITANGDILRKTIAVQSK